MSSDGGWVCVRSLGSPLPPLLSAGYPELVFWYRGQCSVLECTPSASLQCRRGICPSDTQEHWQARSYAGQLTGPDAGRLEHLIRCPELCGGWPWAGEGKQAGKVFATGGGRQQQHAAPETGSTPLSPCISSTPDPPELPLNIAGSNHQAGLSRPLAGPVEDGDVGVNEALVQGFGRALNLSKSKAAVQGDKGPPASHTRWRHWSSESGEVLGLPYVFYGTA